MTATTGKTALIIGASRGLGYALAAEYLTRGWQVTATVRGTRPTDLHDLAKEFGGGLGIETVDITVPEEIAAKYGFELKLVRDIALLVDRNEYKRKQAAPGLKITPRAFGFGRPFPMAQRYIP